MRALNKAATIIVLVTSTLAVPGAMGTSGATTQSPFCQAVGNLGKPLGPTSASATPTQLATSVRLLRTEQAKLHVAATAQPTGAASGLFAEAAQRATVEIGMLVKAQTTRGVAAKKGLIRQANVENTKVISFISGTSSYVSSACFTPTSSASAKSQAEAAALTAAQAAITSAAMRNVMADTKDVVAGASANHASVTVVKVSKSGSVIEARYRVSVNATGFAVCVGFQQKVYGFASVISGGC